MPLIVTYQVALSVPKGTLFGQLLFLNLIAILAPGSPLLTVIPPAWVAGQKLFWLFASGALSRVILKLSLAFTSWNPLDYSAWLSVYPAMLYVFRS